MLYYCSIYLDNVFRRLRAILMDERKLLKRKCKAQRLQQATKYNIHEARIALTGKKNTLMNREP